MVRIPGVEKFADRFSRDHAKFVVIGGTARELIYEDAGFFEDSSTKDLDVVLVAEAVDGEFVDRFISFVSEGGYAHRTKDGRFQMFRFSKPVDKTFPAQIELLSRRPDFIRDVEQKIGPVRVDDSDYSLSAILLDDAYYGLISSGLAVTEKYGMPTLRHEYLPLFKMRAYIDLLPERKHEADKHRRDIIKLFSLDMPPAPEGLPTKVLEDVRTFTESVTIPPDLMKRFGLGFITGEEMLGLIEGYYLGVER